MPTAQTNPSVSVPAYSSGDATQSTPYEPSTFFLASSISVAQQTCSINYVNATPGPIQGINPIELKNTAATGFRKNWVVTLFNNQPKTTTIDWTITCNGVKSAEIKTTFTYTAPTPVTITPLKAGTAPSAALTGTYYTTASSTYLVQNLKSSTWFTDFTTNTGVSCTLTADSKANGNLKWDASTSLITVTNQATAFTSTGNKISCTSTQQTTAQDISFDYTWTGCAVAARSVANAAGNGASYESFQGVKGTNSQSFPDITTLFFANTNCPTSAVQGTVGAAATSSDCKATTGMVTFSGVSFINIPKTAPTDNKATLVNGVRYGYSSSATINCTPKGASAAISSTATVSQACFQVLTAAAQTNTIVLTRSTTTGATTKVVKSPIQALFTGYDSSCGISAITKVSSSMS